MRNPTDWIEGAFPHVPLDTAEAFTTGDSTLSALIVDGVRRALFSGMLNPGDHIGTEARIAQALGVSRMAARDAVRVLVAQGVATVRKGTAGGTRIASGNPARFSDALAVQLRVMGLDLSELIETQIALEATAAELLASHSTPEDVAALRASLSRAAKYPDSTAKFMLEITDFHVTLGRLSGNRVIASLLHSILQVLRDCYGRNTTVERATTVLQSYAAITDAIEAHDPDAARILMRSHLRKVKGEILESDQQERGRT